MELARSIVLSGVTCSYNIWQVAVTEYITKDTVAIEESKMWSDACTKYADKYTDTDHLEVTVVQ